MIALAFALASAVASPKASGVVVYGFPESDSCATWTTNRAGGGYHPQEFTGWILGFVSGFNAFGPGNGDIAPSVRAHGLLGWIDNYCKDNPLDPVTTAGFKLVAELKRRNGR
jgi:hypothetical protein